MKTNQVTNHLFLLKKFGACFSATEWYSDQDSEQAWKTCSKGGWLIWIAVKLKVDHKIIVAASCDCAETVLHLVTDGENRPYVAIKTTRKWIDGEVALQEVKKCADAATATAADADANTKMADLVRTRIPWELINEKINNEIVF